MYLKRSAILIICGLLLVVLSTACSGTTGNTPNAAATTTTGTQQANNQSNGTSQLDNQNTRADGQMQAATPTPTAAPTKASNQSDEGHDADDQNKTSNNKSAVKPTPTPVVNTKKSSESSSSNQNNSNNNSYNSQNSAKAATPTTTSGGTLYIRTQMVTINGTSTKVLTNGQGMTLYYRSSDPAPASTCTGNCAATWPPLLNHNMNIVTSQTLNGTLTVQQTANGPQVLYNNHPLYTYVGDNAAGQANGHGLDGVWYVIQVQAQKMHW